MESVRGLASRRLSLRVAHLDTAQRQPSQHTMDPAFSTNRATNGSLFYDVVFSCADVSISQSGDMRPRHRAFAVSGSLALHQTGDALCGQVQTRLSEGRVGAKRSKAVAIIAV
jgi:hypothetical protein